jgi:hypothetical protein
MGEMICYATAKKISGPWTYQGILTGNAKNSYTIHPGVVEFKGQDYLFYHNATLMLNGQGGALGRRSVCAEYLFYNPDATIKPIRQTVEGVSVPPDRGAAGPAVIPPRPAVSDTGVRVTEEIGPDPRAWPGKPALSTAADPYTQCPTAVSFNASGRPASIGQTFKMESDLRLERLLLYGGDGFGATADEPVTLALYDLGEGDAGPDSYTAETNLFGKGEGLRIAYKPQARGLLQIDLAGTAQVRLRKGHVYAFELQGTPGSAPLFWRRSRRDIYPGGAAFSDRRRLKERADTSDLAIALYGSGG